ncbi:MAG: HD domain-containing protein [Planctomycetes bacterium]|nr:HD domain-containing protein [Planctomycetota bacterium]
MQNSDLEQFKAWFAKYTVSHFGDDPYINANLQLKKDHSARVCDEMDYLIDRLGFNDNDKLIARTTALFHDVGRFPQFVKYQTYMDPRSCDHSCLSVKVLEENNILDGLSDAEQQVILTSIRLHGQKLLPNDLDDRTALFAKLVRDADKLDIFFVVIEITKAYLADPNSFLLELELPDDPSCTDEIVDAVIDGKLIDYNKLRTMNDARMMQLGWVYDINFAPAFERIAEQKYLEQIAEYLPKTPQTERAIEQVFKYVAEHIR